MTYSSFEENFFAIKSCISSVNINFFSDHSDFAFQFDILGPGSGTFYVQYVANNLIVQPYNYYDHTAQIRASAETILSLVSGKDTINDVIRFNDIDIVVREGNGMKKVLQFFDSCHFSQNAITPENTYFKNPNHLTPWDSLRIYIENLNIDIESKTQLLTNLVKFTKNELHILIVGACGCGKSSTINALFNMDIAQVGYGVDPETQDVSIYKLDNLYLHDSPGLGESPAKDEIHIQKIKSALREVDSTGNAVIDEVLVIVDGSHRDMRSSFELINHVIIPNMQQKDRILVAINRCDLALDGRGWISQYNYPDDELLQRLKDKAQSVRLRIKNDTGVDIEPIFYSALHKYNISKLLSFLIKNAPVKKRVFFAEKINNNADNFSRDDTISLIKTNIKVTGRQTNTDNTSELYELKSAVDKIGKRVDHIEANNSNSSTEHTDTYKLVKTSKTAYQEDVKKAMTESFDIASAEISKGSKEKISFSFLGLIDSIKQGATSGAELGKVIGENIPVIGITIGSAFGTVLGGIGGFFSGIFQKK